MFRAYLNIILVVAMAFSALSPKGYMPQFSDTGFTINICAGGKIEARSIDKDHPNYEILRLIHDSKSDDNDAQNMPYDCAFSIFNGHAYLPDLPTLETVIPSHFNTIISFSFVNILRISGMPPPSTGPPSL